MTPKATSRPFSFYLGFLESFSGEIQPPCRNVTKEFSKLYKEGHTVPSLPAVPTNIRIMNAYEQSHPGPSRPAQVSAKYQQETPVNPTWNGRITLLRPA